MNENNKNNEQHLPGARQVWDAAAETFDDQPDHGLRDPRVLAAWTRLLEDWLPPGRSNVLDAGCGTGSLSLVLAELGHQVSGIDISPAMIARARVKARAFGQRIDFQVMDAAAPQFPPAAFDALVCRHLLWALPDPLRVLQRWAELLKPGGRLLLVEGYWSTGAGLHAPQLLAALPPVLTLISMQNLSGQADLWGGPVSDERYALCAGVRG